MPLTLSGLMEKPVIYAPPFDSWPSDRRIVVQEHCIQPSVLEKLTSELLNVTKVNIQALRSVVKNSFCHKACVGTSVPCTDAIQ